MRYHEITHMVATYGSLDSRKSKRRPWTSRGGTLADSVRYRYGLRDNASGTIRVSLFSAWLMRYRR